jgi:hypothetical protein
LFQTPQVFFTENSPFSAWQTGEAQLSNANAHELLHVVSHVVKHSTNLLVESLAQHNSEASGTDRVQVHNARAFAIEYDSSQKFWGQGCVPKSVQSHFVFFFNLVAWVSQPLGEIAIIGQE